MKAKKAVMPMDSKWKLFVMPMCANCVEVKKWLDNHKDVPGLEVIVVPNKDPGVDIMAEVDFYDVFGYPALRPANGAGGWDDISSILSTLRDIAVGKM